MTGRSRRIFTVAVAEAVANEPILTLPDESAAEVMRRIARPLAQRRRRTPHSTPPPTGEVQDARPVKP